MSTAPLPQPLTQAELETLAQSLAAAPEHWALRVRHDRDERVYEQIVDERHVEAWLICWMDDHDTGYHDHDVSSGAVAVVSGAVREDRLVVGGEPESRRVGAGAVFSFAAHDIHRVLHVGDEPAVTIHVYSPPLRRMGAYEVGESGRLARHSIPADEELRPLESVGSPG